MSALRSWLVHGWAFLATPIVLATFIGRPFFSRALAEITALRVSPWFVGGDVVREIDHAGYRTLLRRPVFDGLIGQRAEGFVQIEWQPLEGAVLPAQIVERIDYDGDGKPEFRVDLDVHALRARIAAESPLVVGLQRVYDLDAARAIRVRLRRTPG